jgi:hypothetical protein
VEATATGANAVTALSFDTLAYSKKLREAGFTEQQAEAQATALATSALDSPKGSGDTWATGEPMKGYDRYLRRAHYEFLSLNPVLIGCVGSPIRPPTTVFGLPLNGIKMSDGFAERGAFVEMDGYDPWFCIELEMIGCHGYDVLYPKNPEGKIKVMVVAGDGRPKIKRIVQWEHGTPGLSLLCFDAAVDLFIAEKRRRAARNNRCSASKRGLVSLGSFRDYIPWTRSSQELGLRGYTAFRHAATFKSQP